ncbi:MAG TPA: FAD-dependent oxidoreductase [Frankiaceae bacterium]|nr:FAD-dependent oxidoreductase [Frankiaceae bacterium]
MTRVCVVGAGISGIACARVLREAGVEVEIRERAHGPGGRMSSPPMSWSSLGDRRIDTGAAYFTVRDDEFRGVVADWIDRGLAREWTDTFHLLPAADGSPGLGDTKPGPMRYAAPGGLRSLVVDLAEGLPVRTRTLVDVVDASSVLPRVDGDAYDAVVLAMPDPQALTVLGEGLDQERIALAEQAWLPVLALQAVFPARSWPEFDAGFVQDDEVLEIVVDDGRRRGDDAAVLIANSTSPWAAPRLEDPDAAAGPLAEALDRILGCGRPAETRVSRWTYARPTGSRDENFLFTPRRIGFAGDGWGSPKIETAWRSGTLLGRRIARELA